MIISLAVMASCHCLPNNKFVLPYFSAFLKEFLKKGNHTVVVLSLGLGHMRTQVPVSPLTF